MRDRWQQAKQKILKETLSEIAYRSNINHKRTSENEVVLYEDHRTILNVLYFAKEKRGIEESFDIIMFDNHYDFRDFKESSKVEIRNFHENSSKEKLNELVEFSLSSQDDDWVKAGMELGLINNVFLFNTDDSGLGFQTDYETENFGTKSYYNIGDVWSAIGYHGILDDSFKTEYQEFWERFGWKLENGKFEFSNDRSSYVFDIDLDCFSTEILDKTIRIPDEVLTERLNEVYTAAHLYYYRPIDFIKQLIHDVEFATLCFENGCCGGIRQSQKIFNLIDREFFDSELG